MMNPMATAFVQSPNCSSRNGKDVDGIILHYTRGGDAKGTLKWFQMNKAKVSSHYVVSRSGKIYQMVMESKAAWHAGSRSSVPSLNGREHLNGWTIGIEICNWGPLFKAKVDEEVTLNNGSTANRETNKVYCAAQRWTREYNGDTPEIHHLHTQVVKKDKYWPGANYVYLWEPYPQAQIDAVRDLVIDIVIARNPHIGREWIARHQDVDPSRKLDTGPAFPFSQMLDDIFDSDDDDDYIQVGNRKSDTVSVKDIEEMSDTRYDGKCKWSFLKF